MYAATAGVVLQAINIYIMSILLELLVNAPALSLVLISFHAFIIALLYSVLAWWLLSRTKWEYYDNG